ncbi:hypothetical protein EDC94DRAFT_32754 [Helicostylum pulchrum]|nr:hypothetical protein EDC94DRAFT_32754 [Helicostylum pulchrum]
MTTKSNPTVVIPVFQEKTDTKRLSKPLPQNPLSLIDDSSRNHFLRLVNAWLVDLNIPVKPWCDVLYNIFISMSEKALNNSTEQKNKTIWIQTLTNNSPMDSKFLHNVFHGKQVTNEGFSIEFPIGGTIRIYGLDDEAISGKLMDLVQAIVYLTYSLYLESYVMRDSQVQLIISPPTFQKEKATTKLNLNVVDQHPSITKRSSGLFNWLKKLNPTNTISRSPSPSPPSIEGEKKTRSNPLTIKRGLSLNNISKWYQQPPSPAPNDLDCIQPNDPHRFFKLKQKIQNAAISTSPDCHFPYPALLNRLEVEEDDLILEQKKINSMHNEYDCSTPSTTRPAVPQRRRSSLISSFSSSLKRGGSITTTNIQLPQSITAYSSIRVSSLLADSQKGLEHLNLDTTSLSSFKQHQSITLGFTVYPVGCPDRPCLGPIMSKIDYFRYHAPQNTTTIFPNIDQTLGQMIRHWAQSSQSACQTHMDGQAQFIPGLMVETPLPLPNNSRPELVTDSSKSSDSSLLTLTSSSSFYVPKRQCGKFHGCNQRLLDHIYSFSHGIGRINVYSSMDETCLSADKDKITTWLSCSTCDAVTTPVVVSEKTDKFSFAKYLELIFYSSKLSSPQPFCQHTKISNKNIIIRCFHYNGITFKLAYEDAKYYELRVPRIQMAPSETVVFGGTQFEAPRMSVVTLKEWKHKSATQDVDLFFESVRAHLDLLNHYTKAEARRKQRGVQPDAADAKKCQAESKSLDGEIKALSKRLDTDHQSLLQILADTSINELNDFRRHFAIQSESIIQYLTEWQMTKCEEVSDAIAWDSPDYISKKTVHCFPGSSVLVREDEPTSIIAYTLSSNDYMQAILHDDGGTEFSDSGSIPSLSSSTESSTTEAAAQALDKKQFPQQSSDVIDGYYSSIERKYVSPSTGASTETASFRTMVIEVVKSSVVEAQMHNTKRLEDLKTRLSPWTKKQQEEGELKRQKLTERTLKPLVAVQEQQQQETTEVKVASFFYENNTVKDTSKKNISPHIKHKFVHEGIEFTCIVYYAKEFEMLRKQCDINQLIVQSLCRCQSWTASGGKSKSHFYKTQDDRLVIKEMMNAWNVAEKDAFLKFAPKYFEHMKRSANEPSVLAKIFGFFTIRMKNTLDKKAPLFNLDVMVMEHLFYNQNIIKRFDFKGIQDRQVEEFRKQQKDTTLWDKDWINEYRTRLSVHEQSKAVLECAIANDTEFLSKCNIMDYSLLVGIDQDKYEMTVGIVDFIGAYTWYKKLESKSKSTLQPRKEVTVVPPDQYKQRFCREVGDYFIPVPGKFDLVAPSSTLPSLLI